MDSHTHIRRNAPRREHIRTGPIPIYSSYSIQGKVPEFLSPRLGAFSNVSHIENFVLPHPAWRHHFSHIPRIFAYQGARDRRTDGNLSLLDIRFIIPDNLISNGCGRLDILQIDGCTEYASSIRIQRRRIDDLGIGELALKFSNTSFDKTLTFLGRQ